MKQFLLIFSLLFPLQLLAQETVHPITVVQRENSFYKEQRKLWKAVTEKEPTNELAWENLYKAARYQDFPAIFKDEDYKKEVSQLVDEMGKAIPNSYEYHYIYAWHHSFGEDNLDHLLKAYEIDSTRPKIYEDLFTHYYARGEWETAERYMNKWYKARSLAPQLLYFCRNFLACTEEKGILFLAGDNDSYPTWMLQTAMGYRNDVAAINVFLMMDPDHARSLFKRYQLKYDEADFEYLKRGPEQWKMAGQFIRRMAELNPERPIYLPLTLPEEVYEDIREDLYIVGPLFQYHPGRFDNMALLKKNWQHNIRTDYLESLIYGDGYNYSPKGLPHTASVYLYPSITLYHHYGAAGEPQKAAEMLDFAKKISRLLGKPDLYKEYEEGLRK